LKKGNDDGLPLLGDFSGRVRAATCDLLPHARLLLFVQGEVPPGKDPRQVDGKLLEKYEIALTSAQRHYRKRQGGRASITCDTSELDHVATHGVIPGGKSTTTKIVAGAKSRMRGSFRFTSRGTPSGFEG